jgi:hypothetical protein
LQSSISAVDLRHDAYSRLSPLDLTISAPTVTPNDRTDNLGYAEAAALAEVDVKVEDLHRSEGGK